MMNYQVIEFHFNSEFGTRNSELFIQPARCVGIIFHINSCLC